MNEPMNCGQGDLGILGSECSSELPLSNKLVSSGIMSYES